MNDDRRLADTEVELFELERNLRRFLEDSIVRAEFTIEIAEKVIQQTGTSEGSTKLLVEAGALRDKWKRELAELDDIGGDRGRTTH